MITISHIQARRLIHAQLNSRNFPDEQWSALQAHLEGCSDCQDYRQRMIQVERGVRRTLHQRWDPVDGPREATAPALAALFLDGKEIRRTGGWLLGGAFTFLLCVLVFIGWSSGLIGGVQAEAAPVDTPVPVTPTPLPTPTRTPADYRGVIAYEYLPGADHSESEIYLLNFGAEPINLTNHPDSDRAPAWSPDGEWLAFLSSRTGKDEIYVMHISGSRLTQLSDLPEVDWLGTISWSPDGQMLALLGEREMDGQRETWVYIVPLDGSNAYPLGSSAGAIQAAFSPSVDHRLLAFSGGKDWDGRLVIYDFEEGQETFHPVDASSSTRDTALSQFNRVVDLFEWSADGTFLLFRFRLKNVETNSHLEDVRSVSVIEDLQRDRLSSSRVAGYVPAGSFSAISWTSTVDEVAFLGAADDPGCRYLQLRTIPDGKKIQKKVTGLCVEDGLALGNWTGAEKTLLVTGHEPAKEKPSDIDLARGLYVLRFQDDQTQVAWLADAEAMIGAPRLRPVAPPLAIAPQPVRPAAVLLLEGQPAVPGPETGDLLVTWRLNERTLIDRLAPAGSQRMTINQSVGVNSCPKWSPDHTQIAFLSDRASANAGQADVFVMDSSGRNLRQLTKPRFPYRVISGASSVFPAYSCPVWSTNGRWLAALVSTPAMYVVAIPLREEDGAPRYLQLSVKAGDHALAWMPDGRLLVSSIVEEHTRLYALPPTVIENRGDIASYELLRLMDWSMILDAVSSPDGRQLAVAVLQADHNGRQTFGLLRVTLNGSTPDQPGEEPQVPAILPHFRIPLFVGNFERGSLQWLADGRIRYTIHYPAGRRIKAEVFRVDPEGGGAPEPIAAFTDPLLAAAWSEDGQWLAAINGSGRWLLNAALSPDIPLYRVGGEIIREVDW